MKGYTLAPLHEGVRRDDALISLALAILVLGFSGGSDCAVVIGGSGWSNG